MIEGKIALVTGASRGIGKAIAKELSSRGVIVIGTSTSEEGAKDITEQLSMFGGIGVVLNVGDVSSCNFLYELLNEEKKIPNILVNNAGITKDALSIRMKDSDWDDVININLSSVFRLCKRFIPNMIKAGWGRIINISSIVGSIGNVGQSNYASSKAGVEGFSRVLAKEFASRGITVNCVAPGFIDTDMTRYLSEKQIDFLYSQIPAGRLGCVEDIAYAVSFLSSSRAGYINGVTLNVNGGMYM